jgi:benzoyl-CoA reductase/2-hydroxyglutaryl-CoA dehydratase subunit BcrC/BadD/HgdB
MKNKIIPYEILYEALETTRILVEGGPEEGELLVLKSFLKHISKVVERYINDAENGILVLGHHFAFPTEVFFAYDIVPIVFEGIPYILSALLPEGSESFYDIADSWGHPYHTCTSQKGVLGMTLNGMFQFDVITTPTAPCDNTFASYPVIKEIHKKDVPFIIADMPFYHDERGYKYYGAELKKTILDVGKALNQEPDWDKFRKAIDYSNEALRYISEINELRRIAPCPIDSMLCPLTTAVLAFIPGQPERAMFFKDVLEIAKKRAKRGERAYPGEEKIRSIWPYMSIFFDIGFCEWLDREIGMSMLLDIFNYLFLEQVDTSQDVDDIINGVAKQSMEYPMVRQSQYHADTLIEDFVHLSKEYEAECAIFTAHIGCKQSVSLIQLLREALRDEVGIPMLTVDIDIGDARYTSIQTVKKEIKNFVKTVL